MGKHEMDSHESRAMNQHYSTTRKIDPNRGAFLGDGTPNDANRVEIGPTGLAFREWEAAGLTLPNLPACSYGTPTIRSAPCCFVPMDTW